MLRIINKRVNEQDVSEQNETEQKNNEFEIMLALYLTNKNRKLIEDVMMNSEMVNNKIHDVIELYDKMNVDITKVMNSIYYMTLAEQKLVVSNKQVDDLRRNICSYALLKYGDQAFETKYVCLHFNEKPLNDKCKLKTDYCLSGPCEDGSEITNFRLYERGDVTYSNCKIPLNKDILKVLFTRCVMNLSEISNYVTIIRVEQRDIFKIRNGKYNLRICRKCANDRDFKNCNVVYNTITFNETRFEKGDNIGRIEYQLASGPKLLDIMSDDTKENMLLIKTIKDELKDEKSAKKLLSHYNDLRKWYLQFVTNKLMIDRTNA